jgi:16S rRNA (cytosine967-C5)-methyltransferase
MIAPARTAAFQTLRLIEDSRLDLASALARARSRLDDERDRALALDIATGTLRWQRSLDALIEHFARRELARIDVDVRVILRLSLYQLLHLDRVPAAAVVDDAVNLTRAAGKTSAGGFVNAVLRTALRQRHRLPLPDRPSDPQDYDAAVRYLGITHSHPDWYVRRLLDRHGFDAAEAWVRFNNEAPRLTLRANTLQGSREALQAALAARGIESVFTAFAPHGLTIASGNPLRGPTPGTFVVQDEASQLVPLTVAACPGERVLDVCAAPGNKTTALAADMSDHGLVVACDVRDRRIRLLRETVQRSGARCIRVVRIPAHGVLPFAANFDRAIVDAPCSGMGTVRRDPDVRWRRTEQDLVDLSARQQALLRHAAAVVTPGGRLVYATCSSEPEENEQVVDAFLATHTGWDVVDLRGELPAALHGLLDPRGMLRTLPFAHRLEAFFAAALQRGGDGGR